MSKLERACMQCGEVSMVYNSQVKRGGGKFCSISCGTTYRNLKNNPTKCPEVRKKISDNHADVSGENNPMYGRVGRNSPNYKGIKSYRVKAFETYGKVCNKCKSASEIQVHHKDRNRSNNTISNLEVLCRKCHDLEHKEERIIFSKSRRCSKTGRFLKESDVNV